MSNLPGTASFNRVPFGVGGQNIKGFVFNDGSAVNAIDIHGAWHLAAGASKWTYLFGATNLPSGVKTPGNTWSGFAGGPVYNSCSGCADISGCASDSTKFAMIVDGQLCTTTNSGTLFVESGFPRSLFDSNGNDTKNWMGHFITYQSNNASNILFGTYGNSVYYSTDGGVTPHNLSVAAGNLTPGGNPSPNWTAYDPTSSGNRWFYTRYGFGIYMSTTGINGTYTLMASLPAGLQNINSLYVDTFGTLWATGYLEQGIVHKWTSGGGWTTITPSLGGSNYYFNGVAVDPANANHIVFVAGANYFYTPDGGTTWLLWTDDLTNNPLQQTEYEQAVRYLDIPTVISTTQQFNTTSNMIQFDPNVAGRLWSFGAIDVCYADLPSTAGQVLKWVGVGQGIEATVGNSICCVPGGKTFYSMWDVGCFREDSLTLYVNPQVMAVNPGDTFAAGLIPPALIQPCMQVGYGADNPSALAFMQWGGFFSTPKADPHFGTSPDGGTTLLPIAATVPDTPSFAFGGGSMTVGKQGHAIVLPSYNRLGWYTEDNFATVHYLTTPFNALDGSGVSGWDFSGNGFWYNRYQACYDALGDYYYVFNYGNANTPNPIGVWRSRLPSGPWVNMTVTPPVTNTGYNLHMKWDPTSAGNLFMLSGLSEGNSFTGQLVRSINGGVNWTTPTTNSGQVIQNVTDIGFGYPSPTSSIWTKFFWGQVNGVWGLYRSDDDLVTSTFLTANPANSTDYPVFIAGDPNVYGQFRFVQSGSGAMIGSYNYPLTLAA